MDSLALAEKYITSTNVSVFLTGKAGTGKTTFLRHIVETAGKRLVVLAPTGVAAVNAGGVTIHSFFQLPLCPYLPDVKELVTEYQMPDKYKTLRKEKIKIIRTLDLVIIDEISMVRADLLDAVDMTLRRYRRNNKPFGGVQLLMIGDVQQLPPVVKDSERHYMEQVYPSPFFFHSKALQRINYVTIELHHIFRQQDERFIGLLNNIRDNRFDRATLDALNSRLKRQFDPPDSEGYIRLTTHNYQSDSVNHRKLESLPSTPIELDAVVEGNFPESSYPTEARLVLKKGAQVMFVKNNSSGGLYYNGKIATVEGYDKDEGIAVVDREGNHITVKLERWENMRYEIDPNDNQIKQVIDGTFTQFPLRLAWAITIHKSQGLTFDKVIIDAASAFTYGQVYVALSRCRTMEGLVLATPISESCVFDNADIMEFNSSFPTEEEVAGKLRPLESGYFYELVYELFDFSEVVQATERLNNLFQQHFRRLFAPQAQQMSDLANNKLVEITGVAEKFHRQLTCIGTASGGDTGDTLLLDRVGKGAVYFDQQLEQFLTSAAPLLEIETKNKAVAAELKDKAADFRDAVGLKRLCLKRVGEQGFSTRVYNQAKVDFMLEKEKGGNPRTRSGAKRRQIATKEPKEPKPPSWRESARLLAEGKSVEEIARQRGMSTSTIGGHLETALEAGELDIDLLLSPDDLDEITEYIVENRPESLTELYQHFGGKYPFYKLRAARFFSKDIMD